jgi:hypothetical protein
MMAVRSARKQFSLMTLFVEVAVRVSLKHSPDIFSQLSFQITLVPYGQLHTTILLKEYSKWLEVSTSFISDYPAEIVKNYSEKQFDDLVKSCLFQEFKIKVVTKFENTTNGKRIKHNVAKLFPLDHTAEAKNNLDYIRKRI